MPLEWIYYSTSEIHSAFAWPANHQASEFLKKSFLKLNLVVVVGSNIKQALFWGRGAMCMMPVFMIR